MVFRGVLCVFGIGKMVFRGVLPVFGITRGFCPCEADWVGNTWVFLTNGSVVVMPGTPNPDVRYEISDPWEATAFLINSRL
jgi:hypothetical protein